MSKLEEAIAQLNKGVQPNPPACFVEDCQKTSMRRNLCGLHREQARSLGLELKYTTVRKDTTTHGLSRSRTYKSFIAMKTRCNNPNTPYYENYGGRGIKICKRWDKFENFLADMGERPEGESLDRINNNGNYTPSNCRWADKSTQQINQRIRRDNKSGYKGVMRDKKTNCWIATIKRRGVFKHLGFYHDIQAAIDARKAAEVNFI